MPLLWLIPLVIPLTLVHLDFPHAIFSYTWVLVFRVSFSRLICSCYIIFLHCFCHFVPGVFISMSVFAVPVLSATSFLLTRCAYRHHYPSVFTFSKKLSEICTLPISIKRNNLKNTLAWFFFSFQSFFKPFRFLNVDKQCFYCMSIASLVSSFLFNNTSQEVHVDCTYLYNVAHRDLAFL